MKEVTLANETDPYADRRGLTFAQAEGVQELPVQLALGEVSQALRARILLVLLESIQEDVNDDPSRWNAEIITGDWGTILFELHTLHWSNYPDEYKNDAPHQQILIRSLVKNSDYVQLFDTLQFILTHRDCPHGLAKRIAWALTSAKAAYRVVQGGLIVPVASEAEGQAVTQAFADLQSQEFNGARAHLQDAAKYLTAGSWAPSVRESIHAVEAVAKLLEPTADTLGPALNRFAKAGHIHQALKDGMSKIYGYTSDEKGIRHSLLEDSDAKVDETDALFMFGACASFVTYLIGKGRTAGLIR